MTVSQADELRNKAHEELSRGNEESAIRIYRNLSSSGDWASSYMLGTIYQTRGLNGEFVNDISISNHKRALEWFEKSLRQHDLHLSHYAIAQHYYFGWGGRVNYELAYDHLMQCVMSVTFDEGNSPEDTPLVYVMLGELLRVGLGCKKDLKQSKKYFKKAVCFGFPAGYLGLKLVSLEQKNYFMAAIYGLKGILLGLWIIISNGDQNKLAGIEDKRRSFRIK